jgi:hypothetical protein
MHLPLQIVKTTTNDIVAVLQHLYDLVNAVQPTPQHIHPSIITEGRIKARHRWHMISCPPIIIGCHSWYIHRVVHMGYKKWMGAPHHTYFLFFVSVHSFWAIDVSTDMT